MRRILWLMSSLKWNRPSASAGGNFLFLFLKKSNPTGVGASVDERARLRVSEGGLTSLLALAPVTQHRGQKDEPEALHGPQVRSEGARD